jgi:hypothetical protein
MGDAYLSMMTTSALPASAPDQRRSVRARFAAVVLALGLAVVTVVSGSPPPAAAMTAADQDVYCRSFYRNADTQSPTRGPRIELRDPGDEDATRWKHLVFRASLAGEYPDEEGAVYASVRERDPRQTVMQGLYQADNNGFINAFGSTGQGFTGLIYTFDSGSGASLQFFCKAVPEQ